MFPAVHRQPVWQRLRLIGAATVAAVLVACASKPPPAPKPAPAAPQPAPRPAEPPLPPPEPAPHRVSSATNILDYRKEAAEHLYALHRDELYVGRMPPLLYGVMIVETEIDETGALLDVRVRRPPAAPEVGPWIVQMIRKAAPFPPPAKLGKTVYSDIWLVHKGGNFQLDTLTEGQR